MDPTLKALIDLLLKAVPTIFFLIFLTGFLKFVFFKPLGKILATRHEQTVGARKLAEKALAEADHKASEFDRLLSAARSELLREQEGKRRALLQEQTEALAAERAKAQSRLDDVRLEVSREVDAATASLGSMASDLARDMIAAMFGRRAA